MLAAFQHGVPERLDEMTIALRIGDVEPLRQHAHDLVGMAGHLGAEDLAALALDLQRVARGGDLSAAGDMRAADPRRVRPDQPRARRARLKHVASVRSPAAIRSVGTAP